MNLRRNRTVVFVLLAAALLLAAGPTQAATPAEVEAAIAKGKKFLYSVQRREGRWEPDPARKGNKEDHEHMQGQTWGGFTAIATYALLASGESPQDPRLIKAIQFLRGADITGVYALGLRCQVWEHLPQTAEVRALARRDMNLLVGTLNEAGDGRGGWDYDDPTNKGGRIDHSVSQYGVLGLWACARTGCDINPRVWDVIDKTWREHQYEDGSWAYDNDGKGKGGNTSPTAAMTAAGVATLFITQDQIRINDGINCQGNISNEAIEKGLKWMDENFRYVSENNYAWYGVERIGVASGYKYFGTKDWYAEGAKDLLRTQRQDGSWDGGYGGATPIPTTAFALLFLARGRAPIIMNKLDYTPLPVPEAAAADGGNAVPDKAAEPGVNPPAGQAPAAPATDAAPAPAKDPSKEPGKEPAKPIKIVSHWNQRPRDVANLASWMATQTERDLNWQIVNFTAPPEDLHDAPILYISGSQMLQLTDAEVDKLRTFVEQGGMILANGDCGKEIFNKSFRKLGKQLFGRYEFRDLPTNHVIFKEQQYDADRWKTRPKVQGLSNGVRELILLIPDADPARAWQARADRSREEQFQLGSNICLYAVDKKNLQYKGETFIVKDKGGETSKTLRVARLMVGDNPDPEPGGWRRLANVVKNESKLALTVEPVTPGGGGVSIGAAPVAHLTGTTAFTLNESARKAITAFVNGGGTLIIDAAGGSTAFADSAETELAQLFGTAAAEGLARPLPTDHPLYTQKGARIDTFGYRRFARKIVGGLRGPRVRGIKVGDRLAVFYSREDLSAGLVGEPVDGIIGYEPATATQIMRNILLYAQAGGKVSVTPEPKGVKKPAGDVPF